MRVVSLFLVLAAALALSWGLYAATGGHVLVFALPLVFVGPMVWRRRRG